jgi:hypothetical protein
MAPTKGSWGVGDVGCATTARELINGRTNFKNRRGHQIEILHVDLGRIHARPNARGATAARIGLFAADDLGAVGEEALGRSRNGPEFIEKWIR